MIHLCNSYGLDTIETGTSLAVVMEAGVIPFGDAKKAIGLVKEMGKGHLWVVSSAVVRSSPAKLMA